MTLSLRPWVPAGLDERLAAAAGTIRQGAATTVDRVEALVRENHRIHDHDCLNLNPASNVMNPRAEAQLSAGLGSRASLGYPGAKYETGLEAIEELELLTSALASAVFDAAYVEFRVPSGAVANLYAFMATCRPGDTIIVPPASIGGHVTHHDPGAAGLYGLRVLPAPVDPDGYTVDVAALADLAARERPRLITLGGSLNLFAHPVAEVRAIADTVGAHLLFDAAHLCGPIAGKAWPDPLAAGAHLMTMSTYKSLGGPAGGLVLTQDAALAERVEAIAYPGLTANFDAGKTAALAVTLADWTAVGPAYAAAMIANARALADAMTALGLPVYAAERGATTSHAFALRAAAYDGGQRASLRLRQANLLTSGIGLPIDPVDGDLNGLRIGTPELTRLGMGPTDMATLADFVARALTGDPEPVAAEVTAWRRGFTGIHFTA